MRHNFYEKAVFVKLTRWIFYRHLETAAIAPFRYASIRTRLGSGKEPTRCIMASVRTQVLQSIGRSRSLEAAIVLGAVTRNRASWALIAVGLSRPTLAPYSPLTRIAGVLLSVEQQLSI